MREHAQASPDQRRASAPERNVWVGANAGSGKTRVLVQRIIRLMLGGTEPERILCLTYTKAAAGEMAARLFDELSGWIALDDTALAEAISALGHQSEEASLTEARRLFTRALETPGGLKLQTIHAFCERLLQLFPVEAGVAPGFSVMEEREAAELMAEARGRVLDEAGDGLARDFERVSTYAQSDRFDSLISAILSERGRLEHVLSSSQGLEAATKCFEGLTSLRPNDSPTSITKRIEEGCDPALFAVTGKLLAYGGKHNTKLATLIANVAAGTASRPEIIEGYLKSTFDPRTPGGMMATKFASANPDVVELVQAEQQRLLVLLGLETALAMREAGLSLFRIAARIIDAYQSLKRERGLYDFSDLIIRTRKLLTEEVRAPWVLYKLDGGIDHVLVDEAQDTSAAQWDIVKTLTEEFFAGAGARQGVNRTIFAVGDRKQSIYSFQGADPDAFDAAKSHFTTKIEGTGVGLRTVPLNISYRSAQTILDAVDHVFAPVEMKAGIASRLSPYETHVAHRKGLKGLVELWPLIPKNDAAERDYWTAPLDRASPDHPRVVLANTIAHTIKEWIKARRRVSGLTRPVQPGDILILVRRRPFFNDQLIRALQSRGIPVAGADRLKLVEDIAVRDLLSLARVALLPEDDLALAELLRGPLGGLDEEGLFALAYNRGGTPLLERLRGHDAHAGIARWIALARRESPFDFFHGVLVETRRQFHQRFGAAVDDVLDAFLDVVRGYEQRQGASLTGFLEWFEDGETEVKREMDRGGGAVRIMTVHGAKGLEAPIVFMPDTTSLPDARRALYFSAVEGFGTLPMWKLPHTPVLPEAVEAVKELARLKDMEEYRRLLYVAMTRARNELYICGAEGRGVPEDCWYRWIEAGLTASGSLSQPDAAGIRRMTSGTAEESDQVPAVPAPPPVPDWVRGPLPRETAAPLPPRASSHAEARGPELRRGEAVHTLLRDLPAIAPDKRRAAAEAWLSRNGHDPALAGEALAVMAAFPDWFEEGLREVPIAAEGEPEARIDRLIVTDEAVLILDYKTDRLIPAAPEDVNPGYLRQLAIYGDRVAAVFPGKTLRFGLLWTAGPRLIPIPAHALAAWRRA